MARSRRWPRYGLILVVSVVVLWGGGALALRQTIDADFLERVMNDALEPATYGLYRFEIGDVDLGIGLRLLEVSQFALHLDPQVVDSMEALGVVPALRMTGQVDRVAIAGVNLLRLALRRELEAGSLIVDAPNMRIVVDTRPGAAIQFGKPGASAAAAEEIAGEASSALERLTEGLPFVAIERVEVSDVEADLVLRGAGDAGPSAPAVQYAVHGLSFEADSVLIDPEQPLSRERVLFSQDLRLAFDSMRMELPGLHLRLGRLSASSRDMALSVEGIELTPTYTAEEFLAGGGPPGDRIAASFDRIAFAGLDYGRLLLDLEARVGSGRVERFHVDVLSDKQRPAELAPVPFMPHTLFQSLPVRVSVDTLNIADGSVRYSERGPKSFGTRTGSLDVTDMSGVIRNISNDPARMSAATPAMVDAGANLFGTIPAALHAEIPLLDPAPTMYIAGEVGGFETSVVNGILPPLEGVRATGGTADTAWVNIQYGPERATGTVVAIYRDLKIRQESRETGEQNLGQRIVSLAANLVVRGANDPDPGEEPRRGTVDYEVDPELPFFQIFWEAISDGMVDLVMP